MGDPGLRWLLKKAARRGLAATARAGGSVARAGRGAGVHVLTYHRFGDAPRDAFCVAAADFDQHMALLARNDLLVSLRDVEEYLAGRRALRDGAVLVTIDDGCPSLRTLALPVLRAYGVPAVAFVPAGELLDESGGRRGRERSDDRMTWRELEELVRAGVVVGSHSWTHRSLARMPQAEAREEAAHSREVLERRLGQPVTAFAYPFGTRVDYGDATTALLAASGYTCAFTSQHGAVRRGADPLALPRVKVEGGESLWMFRALIRGGLDGWAWVDRTLWKLQAGGA